MALGSPPDDERTALQFLERFLPADELGHLVFPLALLKLLDSPGAVIATHCARLADSTSRDDLWTAAAELETSTFFGDFKVDPRSGAQVSTGQFLFAGKTGNWCLQAHRRVDGPGPGGVASMASSYDANLADWGAVTAPSSARGQSWAVSSVRRPR